MNVCVRPCVRVCVLCVLFIGKNKLISIHVCVFRLWFVVTQAWAIIGVVRAPPTLQHGGDAIGNVPPTLFA